MKPDHPRHAFQGLTPGQTLFFGADDIGKTGMERLEDNVIGFITAYRLFQEAERVLLAVSGGADSIALLHIMHRLVDREILRLALVCIHVNHGLRGAAGDADEAFVVEQATKLGLPLTIERIDVATYAKAEKLSIETAARQLRLACLSEVARSEKCSWIATGHQRDDNAETVLHRLRRGTGFRGLGGIWPARELCDGLTWGRPLLNCTRLEIEAYLRTRGLVWREDHTNSNCIYTRNHIRHRLLPSLQREASGSLTDLLSKLATSSCKLYTHIARQAAEAEARHVHSTDDECLIEKEALAHLPQPVAVELIRRQLTSLDCGERDLTQRHFRSILDLTRSASPDKAPLLPDGLIACRRGQYVALHRPVKRNPIPVESPAAQITVPGAASFGGYSVEASTMSSHDLSIAEIKHDKSPLLEYLDLGRIKGPLVVRRRQRGDRFQPLGLAGWKRLGKFLTAARVPEAARDKVLVLEDAEGIIWVCPIRISERVKVTDRTRQILVLEVTHTGTN